MRKIDMIGKKFGKLRVISQGKTYFDGRRTRLTWICMCECGNKKTLKGEDLRAGDTSSCGCLRKELLEIDLRKKRFGKLVVIEKSEKIGNSSSTFWRCLCDCGKTHIASSQHLREGKIRSCGCFYNRTEEEELDKAKKLFYKNIEKKDSGCWEWKSAKVRGYGVMWYQKKQFRAHRFSFLIHKGKLDDKKYICHICDNKSCVNPDHLYQGTAEDNSRDSYERGLMRVGEKSHLSKLAEEDVVKILKSDRSNNELALVYAVNENTIASIRSRKTWKHIHI